MEKNAESGPGSGTTETQTAFELADNFVDVLLEVDEQGTIIVAKRTDEALGYDSTDVVGTPLSDLITRDTGIGVDALLGGDGAFRDTEYDERPIDLQFECADGTSQRMRCSLCVTTGSTVLCAAKRIDPPESESATDSAVRGAPETPLVELIGDPVYVLDAEDSIQQVNEAMLECTGYQREALVDRRLTELVPPADYDRVLHRPTQVDDGDTRESTTFETSLVTKDGAVVLTEAHVTLLFEDGEYSGAIGALRDISERKQREQNLDALTGVFTRVFRHNVRNELTIMKGYADTVKEDIQAEHRKHIEKVLERADRLYEQTEKTRLLEEVLEADRTADIDLGDTVDRIVGQIVANNEDVTIDVEVPDGWVVESHAHIDTALRELLENAIEHADDRPVVRTWLEETAEFVTLFVEDESGGLADSELEMLRSGSETELKHGRGVGLWLVRWVIELSNAKMVAHRTEEGTLMGLRFDHPENERTDSTLESPHTAVTHAPGYRQETGRREDSLFVGRLHELRELENAYDAVERTGGHAVLVTGPSGVGKTALVEQFKSRLQQSEALPQTATGACEQETTSPYSVFRQAMADLPVTADIEEMLSDGPPPADGGPDSVTQHRQSLFADIAAELRSVALEEPLVLFVEDLHWADEETVALLEYLIEEVGQWAPQVLFVGTYRTEDVSQDHPILTVTEETAVAGRGMVLELEAFEEDDVAAYLARLFDTRDLPPEFVSTLCTHTGGRPQFLAEIGHNLLQAVGRHPTHEALQEAFAELSLSESTESAVSERLERLSPTAREVLEVGAVVGQSIRFGVLREATEFSEGELVDAVDELARQHLWHRRGGRLKFAHGVIQETVCGRLDEDRRRLLHERVATAIESQYESLEDHYARLAGHFREAGNPDRAVEYYRQAGDRAADVYAHETALETYQQALSVAEDAEPKNVSGATLRADIATVRQSTGAFEAALDTVDAGLETAPTPSREQFRLLEVRCGVQQARGDLENAQETAATLRTLGTELDEEMLELRALEASGKVAGRYGDYEQAAEFYAGTLSKSRVLDDKRIESKALSGLAGVAFFQGDFESAKAYMEESTTVASEIGDRQTEANSHNNLGEIHRRWGEYDVAKDHYQTALEISEEIEFTQQRGNIRINVAETLLAQGKYAVARKEVGRGLETIREVGDKQTEANGLTVLGEIHRESGDIDDARRYFEDALSVAQAIGHPDRTGSALLGLGKVAQETDDSETAREHYERARELFEQTAHEMKLAQVRLQQARLAFEDGDVEEAHEQVSVARDQFTDLNAVHWSARSRRLRGRVLAVEDDLTAANEELVTALDTFETVGAPHDSLQTLRSLFEYCGEDGERTNWSQTAQEILAEVPETVAARHRSWVDRECGGDT